MSVRCKIITCPEWNAKPPKRPPTVIGKSKRIVFHHTASHHRKIADPSNESIAESIRYAKDIQNFQMGRSRGWNDSGHNFLVCRNGTILQGRWLTVATIRAGHMVESAHCPGQNDQIGIEHEHVTGEKMTAAQRRSSARLMAWIADQYSRSKTLPVAPHKKYFPTACPDNLVAEIPPITRVAQQILEREGGL
jgi:N-acetylmuramoyl-L-alanine amidase